MSQRPRNVLIGIAIGIAAVLLVALVDGAFRIFFPSLSGLRIGSTDLATCFVMVELLAAFLAAGHLGKRWVGGWAGLLSVVLPLAVLYVWAIAKAPYFYGCDPTRFLWGCFFVHSPFVIGILASCVGYVVRSRRVVPHVV